MPFFALNLADYLSSKTLNCSGLSKLPRFRQITICDALIANVVIFQLTPLIHIKCVVVTTGSSAGFLLAFLSAFSPGDQIGVPNPGYPAYRNMLSALSLQPVLTPAGAQQAYRVTPEALDAAGPLKGLLIASPNNPTGAMLPPAELGVLAQWSEARSVHLISDEIYHGLAFEKECMTARRFSKRPIVVNSFSKYFCMTGWRIGWLIVPDELLRSVECLAQNRSALPQPHAQYRSVQACVRHAGYGP